MTAKVLPITIEQGATYTLSFGWYEDSLETPGTPGDPVPLDNTLIRMQVRKRQQAPVLLEATNDGQAPFITHNDAGVITIKVPAAATSLLSVAQAVYDLEVVFPGDDVFRVLEGPVTIKPNITQLDGEPTVR